MKMRTTWTLLLISVICASVVFSVSRPSRQPALPIVELDDREAPRPVAGDSLIEPPLEVEHPPLPDLRVVVSTEGEGDLNVATPPTDADYGAYQSLAAVQEAATQLALSFAPTDAWIVNQAKWKIMATEYADPPIWYYEREVRATDGQREAARRIAADYYGRIVDLATDAYWMLRAKVKDYVQYEMKAVALDARVSPTPQEAGDPERPQPHYVAYTMVKAGPNKFVVNFRSDNYPELEALLLELKQLKAQRDVDMYAAFGITK